ncbi:MAG: transposase [Eubacteriaceae bacterium]|nr:transposase [Eubacteriaceae bacterium]
MSNSESETSWDELFSHLKERGLTSVDLVVSDNHKGLLKAINRHFQETTRQRCQTHFSRNILDKTPKKHQPELKKQLRRIDEAKQLLKDTFDAFKTTAPKAMETLVEQDERWASLHVNSS